MKEPSAVVAHLPMHAILTPIFSRLTSSAATIGFLSQDTEQTTQLVKPSPGLLNMAPYTPPIEVWKIGTRRPIFRHAPLSTASMRQLT